jgi:hypothetical protein
MQRQWTAAKSAWQQSHSERAPEKGGKVADEWALKEFKIHLRIKLQ